MLIAGKPKLGISIIPFSLFWEHSALAPGGFLLAPVILSCEDTQTANVGLCVAPFQYVFLATNDGSRSLPRLQTVSFYSWRVYSTQACWSAGLPGKSGWN